MGLNNESKAHDSGVEEEKVNNELDVTHLKNNRQNYKR